MKKHMIISLITGLLILFNADKLSAQVETSLIDTNYVTSEKTAVKIAKIIWRETYGSKINKYKPFKAILVDDKIWKVFCYRKNKLIGGPYIEIQKNNCKIMKVEFYK